MITLRPYQLQYKQEIRASFARGNKRVIFCSPTGSGKTYTFSDIVREAAYRGTPTLILTHRSELIKQTFKSLDKMNVTMQVITKESKRISPDALVNVGMIKTILSRLNRGHVIMTPQLIVIDEAHRGEFGAIYKMFPDAYIIGATATPVGKHFYQHYTDLIQCVDVPQLIEEKSLLPCKTIYMQRADFSDLEVVNGEYTDKSQFSHFSKSVLYDGLIEQIKKHIGSRKTIIYCVNVAHAEETLKQLQEAGYTGGVVTGETPDNIRDGLFKQFSYGAFQFLVNVEVATTGFDDPSIEAVILYLKTKSLIKYLQCVGRAGRLFPGLDYFVFLDFGENYLEHGGWDEPRNWAIEPPKKRKKLQPSPKKNCPECDAMLPAQIRECGFCGYKFESKEDEELIKGYDVEVTSSVSAAAINIPATLTDLTLEELKVLLKSKQYKSTEVFRIVRAKGGEALEEFALIMGYKHGWVERQMGQGWKPKSMELEEQRMRSGTTAELDLVEVQYDLDF